MSALQTSLRQFRSAVAQQKVDCDGSVWTFFDDGPRNVPPLLLLHGVSGTGDSFFRQFHTLVPRGYRLIAVQWPPLWTVADWVKSFDRFLDGLKVNKAHLFGTGLGGYLALCFAQYRPNRIASIVLNNAFIDTHPFYEAAPCVNMIKWTPLFVLQRQVLKNLPTEPQEAEVAASIDFMVEQLETLTGDELASRLILNCSDNYIRSSALTFDGKAVTMVDVLDQVAVPQKLRDEMYKFFPDAKIAHLKTGGNFPFLSRADEVNLHLQVHLRAHGIMPHVPVDPNAALPVPDKLKGTAPAEESPLAVPAPSAPVAAESKKAEEAPKP